MIRKIGITLMILGAAIIFGVVLIVPFNFPLASVEQKVMVFLMGLSIITLGGLINVLNLLIFGQEEKTKKRPKWGNC